MMLIKKAGDGAGSRNPLWVVEGRIVGEYASLLWEEYLGLPAHSRSKLVLDLRKVTFVDDEGAQVLSSMQLDQVHLVGVGAFVHGILRQSKPERVHKSP